MKSFLLSRLATVLVSALALSSTSTSASTLPSRNKMKPLFFQADKNNLEVLPQRFEYALLDEDRIQIGDILIDSSQLNFKIIPVDKESYKLSFKWPAGLLLEGSILIKDNAGKAIFSSVIDKNQVKISAGSANDVTGNTRSELAEYLSPEISPKLIEDMKFLPFMNFCIFREEANTRIYLCSKELYIGTNEKSAQEKGASDKNTSIRIKSRSLNKKPTEVNINGSIVGNQGLVFLNDASENLVLKAYSQSGATLEIETRRNDVDFKDVVVSEDGKNLILTASGAEPANPKKVRMLNKDDWQIRLPLDRPYVYLKGDGDIPMRQEFLVKGVLPSEKDRIFLERNAISRTYSQATTLNGFLPNHSTATANDPNSILSMPQSGQFQWTLNNISPDIKNRRYLTIKDDKNTFIAGYDIYRGTAFELAFAGRYLVPSTIAAADLHFYWWIEDFLFIKSSSMHLHWGIEIDQQQHLTSKSNETKIDSTTLEFFYRFNSGFYHEDESWGLSLPYQMLTADGQNTSALGMGAFVQKKSPKFLTNWLSWYNAKFDYFLSSSGDNFKLKGGYQLEAIAYRALSSSWNFNYGLGLSQYKFDPSTQNEASQLGVKIGTSYHF